MSSTVNFTRDKNLRDETKPKCIYKLPQFSRAKQLQPFGPLTIMKLKSTHSTRIYGIFFGGGRLTFIAIMVIYIFKGRRKNDGRSLMIDDVK